MQCKSTVTIIQYKRRTKDVQKSEISQVKLNATFTYNETVSELFFTAGFYCDSWAHHNVMKVRVVKYRVVYGQIKSADQ